MDCTWSKESTSLRKVAIDTPEALEDPNFVLKHFTTLRIVNENVIIKWSLIFTVLYVWLVVCLFVCLVGWLVSLFVGWLFVCLFSCLVCLFVGCLFVCLLAVCLFV